MEHTDTNGRDSELSFIMPACNEADGLKTFLPQLKESFPNSEILVVNDGSKDDTESVSKAAGAKVITHFYQMGNGAALKTGARMATRPILVFLDADGQHTVTEVTKVIDAFFEDSVDMAVGARSKTGQASAFRGLGNKVFNSVATMVVGHKVMDLTSGCRVVKAPLYREFLHLLPNGFSAPTTITLAFFKSGYTIKYVPIEVMKRIGNSHLKPLKDGVRFSIILYKIATLYSPLKIFFPLAFMHIVLGLGYAIYTRLIEGLISNTGAIFFTTGVLILIIGLVSEQITIFLYQTTDRDYRS